VAARWGPLRSRIDLASLDEVHATFLSVSAGASASSP
jgi:hypothetical protein